MDYGYREVDSLKIVRVECCDLVAQITRKVQEGHNFQIQMVAGLRRRWLRTPLKSLMTLILRRHSCGCGACNQRYLQLWSGAA